MRMQLLEIGSETEQLSACKLSLLLGVFTASNQVESFLNLARKILGADEAVFAFHNEPYIWYASNQQFKAFTPLVDTNLSAYFSDQAFVDVQHPQYPHLVQHISKFGVKAERYIAFDLRLLDGRSVGQILFFDKKQQSFDVNSASIVVDCAANLMRYIELKVDYVELKELHEQQVALNYSKTKFFQIIAHDLRAPFHGLLGFSEVLVQERDTLDDASVQSISEYLYDTTQSTYNLLESLLNWAMAEGGRFIYHPINFELKQSSKIVCSVLNSLAIKKDIRLIDQIADDLKVYADINMITSVIQNLVSNALKFTPTDGKGQVIISARHTDAGVQIAVQDNGLGMSQAQIGQLFKESLSASIKGTAGEKGTGLGLMLCKRFIELNHGDIVVVSNEGEGTTFTVTLPVATSNHQALTPEQAPAELASI